MAFKKGVSGNPTGRRRGSKNKRQSITAELERNNSGAVKLALQVVTAAIQAHDYSAAARIVDRLLVLSYAPPAPEQEEGRFEIQDPRFSDDHVPDTAQH